MERRLGKLEEVYQPPEIMFIYLEFVGLYVGEIVACSYGWGDIDKTGDTIWREPGEPEKDFLERVEATARAQYVPDGREFHCISMRVIREDDWRVTGKKPEASDVKTEPQSDPVATTQPPQPTVKPKQPLSNPLPKPQPPRIMTIKEAEGQFADRSHWMG
jgi:hypothetical protein